MRLPPVMKKDGLNHVVIPFLELLKIILTNLTHIIPANSFSGGGESFLYLISIADEMHFYRELEEYQKKKPWYYLYTNGILADLDTVLQLKALGFDEIRFHLGGYNFSKKVYKNKAHAIHFLKTVTV